jgi:flagellar basal body-associated protein FliL
VIRMIILSIAACLSTVGGVYGAVVWKKSASESSNKPPEPKVQLLKTHMVSVPILMDGQVLGYVVARMQFTADIEQLKTSVQPDAFVADEAFKIIYDTTPSDIKTGRKQALKDLTSNIVSGVNKRLGRDVVKDVFIDSWTYLSKQDMLSHDHAR